MAAAMTMDREPEVARFIDSYKYDQDMATRRDRYGGGTSLPLNSDGYEEKQQRLRDERHKDWLVQQDKAIDHPPSIAKHPFTGPVAAGPQSSADYDEEIQRMTDRYHNRYNEQRQMEQQKYEARRRSPPRPAQPPGPQMDYNLAGEQARAEERRAYQDYMGKYQSSYIPTKVPLDYEENKKILNEERRREYNEMMEQKAKEERYWAMRGRPVTPPGGLDIGKYDRQLKETAQQKKKEYKEMLDQQQREHMYLRARQEPEMAVIDRNAAQPSQYLANKPPPGPSYGKGRDEAEERRRQDEMRHQQQMSKPAELVKNPYYSSDDYEKFQREIQRKQGEEYRDFLAKDEEQRRHSRDGYMPAKTTYASSFKQPPPSPYRKQFHQTPPSPALQVREQKPDQITTGKPYMNKNDNAPHENNQHIPNGFAEHEQGNKTKPFRDYPEHNPYPSNVSEPEEYKPKMPDFTNAGPGTFHHQMTAAYPKASSAPPDTHGSLPATPSKLSLPVGQYDDMRPFIVKQRNKEYNNIKDKLGPRQIKLPQTPETTSTSLPVGQYDDMRPKFEMSRNKEYQDFLKRLPPLKKTGMTPRATDVTLPVGQYDKARPSFEKQRNDEYNELVQTGKIGKRTFRQKAPTPPELQGLPIGQQNYEPMHKAMEYQRNREYNEFLRKKYGGKGTLRSTRSEPPRGDQNEPKSSFYYGNEMEHEEKRKVLDAERRNEYNQFIKELDPPRSRSIEIPSDADSGLPIGQQHHEAWRKFLRNQRNKEYNQLVDMKSTEVHNRGWNFEQNGVLELRGDDEVQTRQRELRAERQKDYNSYISQMKTPSKRTWPDPEGRGALLVKQGEYDNVRQMYDEERKRDYIDRMQKRREMGLDLTPPSAPPEPLKGRYEYNNPMVDVLGRYDDYRKKLVDDRKRDFRTFMDQVKADEGSRRHLVSTAPNLAREETPLVYSMGTYELETKKQMRLERKKDLEDFVHEQQKHWTPRTTVKENLMPHVASAETPLVNYLGHYDKEKLKYRLERNKDLREFSQQKKQQQRNPYDNYVFPTVAVAEKPIVDYMGTGLAQRKRQLRDERKRDYEEYKMQVASNNQKYTNPSRRHDFVDTASGPYGGLFHGLGEHGNKSDVLNKERQQEYNDRLDHNAEQFGKDRPSGRPNWVKETLPNNTDRGRSPMKSQPPADQYQQMLDEKRREEASRRRFEDPEYQDRLAQGRDRGEAGARYGY